jgi:hypothetical protein
MANTTRTEGLVALRPRACPRLRVDTEVESLIPVFSIDGFSHVTVRTNHSQYESFAVDLASRQIREGARTPVRTIGEATTHTATVNVFSMDEPRRRRPIGPVAGWSGM